MIKRIDALLDQLESVCDEFDYIADAESNWRIASRISFYRDHVEDGMNALREMRAYLVTLPKWQLEQLQAAYDDETPASEVLR